MRCRECKNCLKSNCGQCVPCRNMAAFGGRGTMKRACVDRTCLNPPEHCKQASTVSKEDTNLTILDKKAEVKKPLQEKNVSATQTPASLPTVIDKADIPQLPRVALHSMTKGQLKSFTLDLLKLVTGRDAVFHGRRSAKPEWWPDQVPWVKSKQDWLSEKYKAECLKQIVNSCYHHMGREDLLRTIPSPLYGVDSTQKRPVDAILPPTTPQKTSISFPKDLFLPYTAEVYVCFFCEKDFVTKECMRRHQVKCSLRPPAHSLSKEMPSRADLVDASLPPQISPNHVSVMNDSHLPRPKQTDLLRAIGLMAKHDAARLSSRKPSTEVDCDLLTEIVPKSPVLPKTPKSLMSQLSMDEGSSARKRLSYSLSMDKERVNIEEEATSEDESDDESVGSKQQSTPKLNLLNIPITSLLGQRIKGSVNVDSPVSVVEDSSSYCRTPVKNNFLEKLRKKAVIHPVVYKPRRIANLHKQNHMYKFTKAQRKEFMRKANFGLSSNSYKLYKRMKPLRVNVQKLSRKTMLKWMSRWRLQKQLKVRFKGLSSKCSLEEQEFIYGKSEFPSGPSLLSQNIDKLLGLKRKSSENKNSLSLFNCVSEEMEEEASKQKLTLYRSLLYEMSVLKPAVVIQDIKGKDKSTSAASTTATSTKATSTTATSTTATSTTATSAKVQKESDVGKSKVTASKLQEKSHSDILASNEKVEQNKLFGRNDYKTLRSVLNPGRGRDTNCTGSKAKNENTMNDVLKQSVEDSVSILSISSDSESFSSNCCQGCVPGKHTTVASSCLEPLNMSFIDSDSNSSIYPSPVSTCSDEKLYAVTPAYVEQDSPLRQSTPVASSTKGGMFKTPQKSPLNKSQSQTTLPSVLTRSGSKTRSKSGEKEVEQNIMDKTNRRSRESCKRKLDTNEMGDNVGSKRMRHSSVSPIKKTISCVSPVKKESSVSPLKKSTTSPAEKALLDYMKSHNSQSVRRSALSPMKKAVGNLDLRNIKVKGLDNSSVVKKTSDDKSSTKTPLVSQPVSRNSTATKKCVSKKTQISKKLAFKNFPVPAKSRSSMLPLPVKWASKNSTVSEKLSPKRSTNLGKSASKKSLPFSEKSLMKNKTSPLQKSVSKDTKTSEKVASKSVLKSEKSICKILPLEKLASKRMTTVEKSASKGSPRSEKLTSKNSTSHIELRSSPIKPQAKLTPRKSTGHKNSARHKNSTSHIELRSSPVKTSARSPVKTDLRKTASVQNRVTRKGKGHLTRSKSLSSYPY